MFISVDFPEPDVPMIATNSPRSIVRLTLRSACTRTAPVSYTFSMPVNSITGVVMACSWTDFVDLAHPAAASAEWGPRALLRRRFRARRVGGYRDLVAFVQIARDNLRPDAVG